MKDLTEMSEEELADFMFANPDNDSDVGKEAKRRRKLAKTDLTYTDYPVTNILTGEFQGYPFEGWSKHEIKEQLVKINVLN